MESKYDIISYHTHCFGEVYIMHVVHVIVNNNSDDGHMNVLSEILIFLCLLHFSLLAHC